MNKILVLVVLIFVSISPSKAQAIIEQHPVITIDSGQGHTIEKGASGFNVRIADKIWSYNHPDFIAAVDSIQPGWLRYFSGTMGDSFSSATGLYDYDYILQFDHQKGFLRGHKFTSVKGPHRIIDLYKVLGRVGGKLVVTINGFSETPRMAAELARFCKNNNIEVEVWQFCNEPYFYVPNRDRYWWNDGADYALKMKPYADSIKSVFPEAQLALNFTWDGIWGFMKEINAYQNEEGRYWNVFSKHSYAPHIGGSESFESAYRRGNTKLLKATSVKGMDNIEKHSWEGAPMLITEFGVWNRALNGIYSAVYNAEYTLRQLEHENTLLIGSHEISDKARPTNRKRKEVLSAYDEGIKLNTDSVLTGFNFSDEGKAIYLVHQATNHSDFTFKTSSSGGPEVSGMHDKLESGWYTRAFRGVDNYDYLLITNRSGEEIKPIIDFEGARLDTEFSILDIYSLDPKGEASEINQYVSMSKDLIIKPYSVTLLKWRKEQNIVPFKSRIYESNITDRGIALRWWKLDNVTNYILKIETNGEVKEVEIAPEFNFYEVQNISKGGTYAFSITGVNKKGRGQESTTIVHNYDKPDSPRIFQTARRFKTITLFWESVSNASGYLVYQEDPMGKVTQYDAKNTFGYRIENLEYNTEYKFWVTAYNGVSESDPSEEVNLTCQKNLPIPPRNVSAKENKAGVQVQWIVQDTINPSVLYRIYRGATPYNLFPIADDVKGDVYLDTDAAAGEKFYSVKSYNSSGETNYFANTATVIKRDEVITLEVKSIVKEKNKYLVNVKYDNFPTDGDVKFGVAISNISYLNVEEDKYWAKKIKQDTYLVEIPDTEFRKNNTYAVKAVIVTNGSPQYSEPPYKNIEN